MNEKIPSVEIIQEAFAEHCDNMLCSECVFKFDQEVCGVAYAYAILTGKMTLRDGFKKEEPKPTQRPSWCTKGFWVTDDDCKVSSIYEVIESNAKVAKCRRHSAFSFEYQDFELQVANLKPVKFMPYTEEQAERIVRLGMIIRITTTLGNNIIERAERSGGKDGVYDSINAINVTKLGYVVPNAQRVLIGGIPLGVPKVNEEALQKEGWE